MAMKLFDRGLALPTDAALYADSELAALAVVIKNAEDVASKARRRVAEMADRFFNLQVKCVTTCLERTGAANTTDFQTEAECLKFLADCGVEP